MSETRFHTLLKQRVKEAVEIRTESIVLGQAQDYAQYMRSVGYISGLLDALKLCEDIEREFD
jgi:hypothetical protein